MSARRRAAHHWLLVPAGILLLASFAVSAAGAQAEVPPLDRPGGQGIRTELPSTDSEVTVAGRGRFSDLRVTVNQTEQLTNQAVSVSWTGGTQTRRGPGQFAANYLQIFQCWGDPDGRFPENPGPPPEQCVAGATTARFQGVTAGVFPNGLAAQRVIGSRNDENYDPDVGLTVEETGTVWREFRAVDGTVIGEHINRDFNPRQGGTYWTNPYFNLVTTNEIVAAVTRSDGTGTELFQVLTGVESTGLGCGQRVQPWPDGGAKEPQCWLVVVPRGEPVDENVGTSSGGERADAFGVTTSPLSENAWQNRIAIPLQFNSLESPCSIADVERRVAGNDLLLQAIARWQPALCASGDLPPFAYAPVPDSSARQQLTNPTPGSPGLVAIGRPVEPEFVRDDNPLVYAPLALTGVTIGFNVERIFQLDALENGGEPFLGLRVENLFLTPRLVAKLLTQSYGDAVQIAGSDPGYDWLDGQPSYLGLDPDFTQFNPEFELLRIGDRRTFAQLQLPAGNSDAAQLVWEWILADPEAAAWLDGQPDEWGMVVNPAFSTNPEVNPTGLDFADPLPNSFPKADPYCFQSGPTGIAGDVVPPLLCGTDWMPYASSFEETAARARRAFDGARVSLNQLATRPIDAWEREPPQAVGRRSMIALTDAPNSSLLGLQVASLSRAGDNGADREFVEPDGAGFLAALSAMEPGEEPQMLEPSVTDLPSGAYPLTTLTYAATAPLSLDETARSEYAEFVRYAVGRGQERGFEPGQLPVGYEPLPEELRQVAQNRARLIVELEAPPAPTTTTTTPPPPPVAPPPVAPPPVFAPSSPSFGGSTGGGSGGGGGFDDSVDDGFITETTVLVEDTTPVAGTSPPTTADAAPPSTTEPEPIPTPGDDVGPARAAVPLLGGVGLLSMWAALELTKRSRRAPDDEPESPDDELPGGNP